MDFDEYQRLAHTTAIYPQELGLYYLGLGLANEAGEVAGKIKKIIRDSGGVPTENDIDAVVKEVGDVGWYMAELCNYLGLSLGDVVRLNLDKLVDRKERGVIGGSGDKR